MNSFETIGLAQLHAAEGQRLIGHAIARALAGLFRRVGRVFRGNGRLQAIGK